GVQHFVADGIVDLIEDHEFVFAASDLLVCKPPGFLDEPYVLRVRFFGAHLDEPAAHGEDRKSIFTQHLGRVQLPVMPRALNELYHQDPKTLAYRAEPNPQGRGCLALSGPGMHDDQTFPDFGHLTSLSKT